MDFIEVVSQTAPAFRERKLIYIHCLDLGAQESVQFEQFTCLQVKLALGHASFSDKIAERRMCGFSGRCSEGSSIFSPFGGDKQL